MISKTKLLEQIKKMPDQFSMEDLIEQLIFLEKLEKRIEESNQDQTISEEDLKREIEEWSK